jgi:hypothetical protein
LKIYNILKLLHTWYTPKLAIRKKTCGYCIHIVVNIMDLLKTLNVHASYRNVKQINMHELAIGILSTSLKNYFLEIYVM